MKSKLTLYKRQKLFYSMVRMETLLTINEMGYFRCIFLEFI
jgi:hypothetical protein